MARVSHFSLFFICDPGEKGTFRKNSTSLYFRSLCIITFEENANLVYFRDDL